MVGVLGDPPGGVRAAWLRRPAVRCALVPVGVFFLVELFWLVYFYWAKGYSAGYPCFFVCWDDVNGGAGAAGEGGAEASGGGVGGGGRQ